MNSQGAFWALMSGLLLGVARFLLEFLFRSPSCWSGDDDTRPAVVRRFHYLYFAMALFAWSGVVCVVVSLSTQPLPNKRVWRLSYAYTLYMYMYV